MRPGASDLLAASRLALDATAELAAVVEAMHGTIARGPFLPLPPDGARTRGLTRLVYACVRGTTSVARRAVDAALAAGVEGEGAASRSARREALVAALNGVVGDHLAATGNPLAIPMRLRRGGRPLPLERRALAAALRRPRPKVLVLVHGSCRNDLQWRRAGHDHGAALSRALGYTAVYLHYNTGLHVSENGRALADLLERLVAAWPVEVDELAILGHSMGGLVARSACHVAGTERHRWLKRLRHLACLGTPHHGAPLERGGTLVDLALGVSRYSAPIGRLGRLRSAGVTDLRFGSVVEEDWRGRDRFGDPRDRRRPVPLPEGVACFAIAGSRARGDGAAGRLLGDGLVPVDSALGLHRDAARALAFPDRHRLVVRGTDHFELLARRDVYLWLRDGFRAT